MVQRVRPSLFDQSPHAQRGEPRDERDEHHSNPRGAPSLAGRFVAAAPGQDRLGEHIVEELVGDRHPLHTRGRDRAQDATLPAGQLLEHRCHL